MRHASTLRRAPRAPLRAARSLTLLCSFASALMVALIAAAPAQAANRPPNVAGASVLSITSVKVSFDITVDPSAENLANYSISPLLFVTGAQRADGNRTVVLTTAPQLNAAVYGVTVSGVRGNRGAAMSGPQTVYFIGTLLAANSTSVGHDDFNRPSGQLTTDAPIPGPWALSHVSAGNAISFVTSPSLLGANGDRALSSNVTNTDAELDNAALLHAITGREYYTSAYIYLPSGQGWEPGHTAGLLRLNQYEFTAQARISAVAESATAFSLKVDFKSTGGYYGEQLVTNGITFDTWHWYQMRVKNSPADGQPGIVQVWVDGRLLYSQDSIFVARVPMTYAEVGIMHNVTTPTDPPSTTITDAVRMGSSYQLPSLVTDTTAPQAEITAPTAGQRLRGTTQVQISASDDVDVRAVEFFIDGASLTFDDVPPFGASLDTSTLSDGDHTASATVHDTSGNSADAPGVTFVVDSTQATVTLDGAAPTPFSPNGDGEDDVATFGYSTTEPTMQRVTVRTLDGTLMATPLDWSERPAGLQEVTWDGRRTDGSLVPEGPYVMRAEVKDLITPELAPNSVEAQVVVLSLLSGVTAAPTPFSPNGDGILDSTTVDYTLAGNATTTTTIRTPGGDLVRTLQPSASRDPGAYQVTWDGQSDSGPASDGDYVVRVEASTTAGTEVKQRPITLDCTAPTTTDNADAQPHLQFTLVLSPSDEISGVETTEYRIDDGTWQTGTSTTLVRPIKHKRSGYSVGDHVIEYRSTDKVGNIEEIKSCTVTIG